MKSEDLMDLSPLIEQLHDMSMSRNPSTASTGRMLKFVSPGFSQYICDEHARGTDSMTVATSYVHSIVLMTTLLAQSIQNVDEADVSPLLLREIGNHIASEIKSYAENLESRKNAQ